MIDTQIMGILKNLNNLMKIVLMKCTMSIRYWFSQILASIPRAIAKN